MLSRETIRRKKLLLELRLAYVYIKEAARNDALRIEAATNKWLREPHTQSAPKNARKYEKTRYYHRNLKIKLPWLISLSEAKKNEAKYNKKLKAALEEKIFSPL